MSFLSAVAGPGSRSDPFTAPSQAAGLPDGHYFYDISDGRGVVEYYTDTTLDGGPWIIVLSDVNSQQGDSATPGNQSYGNPATTFPLDGSLLNTNIAGEGIPELPWERIMALHPTARAYFQFNQSNRQSYNTELRDTFGETDGSGGSGQTVLTADLVKIFDDGSVVTNVTNTTVTVEAHHGGYDPSSSINYITEIGTRPFGTGVDGIGFTSHGATISVREPPRDDANKRNFGDPQILLHW